MLRPSPVQMAAMACDQASLASRPEGEGEGEAQAELEQKLSAPASADAPVPWPGDVGLPVSPMPKRMKQRLDEMRESVEGKRSASADTIEARLKEAESRRQQFHEWLAERARPRRCIIRPRDGSPGSDREKAQQIAAKISAAQQKKSERMAARQRRLAAVNEQRTIRNHEASARAEREREELGSALESRYLQAESNRQALLEAERARVALANSRKVQKLERLKQRAEEKLALATRRLEAAEAKRVALLEAERTRASAIFTQARKVAETVVRERERESLELREQIEIKVLKARGRREKILGQRSWSSHVRHHSLAIRHGDRLSRKLTRCWRQFRHRKTTLELAELFSECHLTSMSTAVAPAAASLPFETLAERITSATTLKATKAILGRIESRFLATSSESPAMSLEPLLRRLALASAPRAKRHPSTPTSTRRPDSAEASSPLPAHTPRSPCPVSAPPVPPSPQGVASGVKGGRSLTYSERYPVRVFLCAYMILGHPDAVFSAKTSREQALAEAAARLLPSFEALLETILEPGGQGTPTASSHKLTPARDLANQQLPGGDVPKDRVAAAATPPPVPAQSSRPPFSVQLARFDAAWCEYLEQFVAWKVKDVRQMEDEMVRTACKLERSMMRRCGILPTEDASHLSTDFQLMHKQVLVDQGLLQARIMRIAGVDGVARLASALANLRASFVETRATLGGPQTMTPSSPQPAACSPPSTPPNLRSPRSSSLPHRSLRRRSTSDSASLSVQISLRSLTLTDKDPMVDEGSGDGTSSEPETPELSLPEEVTRPRRNSAPGYMVRRSDMVTPDAHTPSTRKGPATPPTSPEGMAFPSRIPRHSPMVGQRSSFKFSFGGGPKLTTSAKGGGAADGSMGKRKDPDSAGVDSVAVPEAFDARMLARALTNGTLRIVSSSPAPGQSEGPGTPTFGKNVAALSNEKMVYELMHNPEWKLPESDESLEASSSAALLPENGRGAPNTTPGASPLILSVNLKDGHAAAIQPISEAEFWASLEASLRNQGQSSPNEELTSGATRVAEIVSRLRDALVEVAPQKMAKEIKQSMDCELLKQILASGNVDFDHMGRLLEYAHTLMLQLGAPARDEEARAGHAELLADIGRVPPASTDGDGVRTAFAHAVVRGVRFVSDRLKVLKLDMANARLNALGPVLRSGAGAQYLRRAFCEKLGASTHPAAGAGALQDATRWAEIVPRTAKWIAESVKATAEAQDGPLAGISSTVVQLAGRGSPSNGGSPSRATLLSVMTSPLGSPLAAAAAAHIPTFQETTAAAAAAAAAGSGGSPGPSGPSPRQQHHHGVPHPSAMRTGRRSIVRSLSFGEPSSQSPTGTGKDSTTGAGTAAVQFRAPVAWSSIEAVVLAGLVAIVSSSSSSPLDNNDHDQALALSADALPETLRLDQDRLQKAQEQFQKIAIMTTGMLVARQGLASRGIAGAAAESAISAVQTELAKLLLPGTSVTHDEIAALVARAVAHVPTTTTLPITSSPGSPTTVLPSSGEELMVRLIKKALTRGDAIFARVSGAVSGAVLAAVMAGDPATTNASALVESYLRKAGAVTMRKEVVDVANCLRGICDVNVLVHGPLYEVLR